MADFNQENNYYMTEQTGVPYADAPVYSELPVQEESAPRRKSRPGSADFFSLPARIGMWIVGVIVGATLVFGCGLFWAWGLDYIGVISLDKSPAAPSDNSGSGYSEYDEFYDYFEDFFGGYGGAFDSFGGEVEGEEESGSAESEGKPGIGVTIQQIVLDFTIDDLYTGGLVVIEISENGALVGTDVQIGDLIVAVNGIACPSFEVLDEQISATGIGGEMILTVARYTNGVAATFEVPIILIDMNAVD